MKNTNDMVYIIYRMGKGRKYKYIKNLLFASDIDKEDNYTTPNRNEAYKMEFDTACNTRTFLNKNREKEYMVWLIQKLRTQSRTKLTK